MGARVSSESGWVKRTGMYYVYCWGQATQNGCWWLINCIEKTEGGKISHVSQDGKSRKQEEKSSRRKTVINAFLNKKEKDGKGFRTGVEEIQKNKEKGGLMNEGGYEESH